MDATEGKPYVPPWSFDKAGVAQRDGFAGLRLYDDVWREAHGESSE